MRKVRFTKGEFVKSSPTVVEQIAKICHDANRSYCEATGDFTQTYWEDAPQWQRESAINGVEFHIRALDAGQKRSPEASHNSWLAEKLSAGWKYGLVKDPEKKEHPCCVPYLDLPLEQRRKDYLFAAIVEALYTAK